VLRRFGNMSSATIMFVLKKIMQQGAGRGCGMAFGPGLTIESMLFQQVA
jgi:predicted naringenin-chalcone synthase